MGGIRAIRVIKFAGGSRIISTCMVYSHNVCNREGTIKERNRAEKEAMIAKKVYKRART